MTIRGCFVFGIARVKALGWLKKEERKKERKKKEKEDDETGFSPFLGLSLKQSF